MITFIATVCAVINIIAAIVNYPEAKDTLKMKLRFRKAGYSYREEWISQPVALFLIGAIGAISCITTLIIASH